MVRYGLPRLLAENILRKPALAVTRKTGPAIENRGLADYRARRARA